MSVSELLLLLLLLMSCAPRIRLHYFISLDKVNAHSTVILIYCGKKIIILLCKYTLSTIVLNSRLYSRLIQLLIDTLKIILKNDNFGELPMLCVRGLIKPHSPTAQFFQWNRNACIFFVFRLVCFLRKGILPIACSLAPNVFIEQL